MGSLGDSTSLDTEATTAAPKKADADAPKKTEDPDVADLDKLDAEIAGPSSGSSGKANSKPAKLSTDTPKKTDDDDMGDLDGGAKVSTTAAASIDQMDTSFDSDPVPAPKPPAPKRRGHGSLVQKSSGSDDDSTSAAVPSQYSAWSPADAPPSTKKKDTTLEDMVADFDSDDDD